MDQTALFYSQPSHGAGFPVFMGSRRQRGGGLFGSLKKFFLPIAKKVGRNLLSQGVGLAKDVMQDAMEGKNIKSSFLDRGKSRAIDFGKSTAREGVSALQNMLGRGSRRAPRRRKHTKRLSAKRISRKRSRKRARKPLRKPSRKRKSGTSHTRKAKRRRTNF